MWLINLKKLRLDNGLTQQQVADAIGCSVVVYSRYETGAREPSIDMLKSLSDYYSVSIDYIVDHYEYSGFTLSKNEQLLIEVFRKADDRAKKDAIALLKMNPITT